MKFVYPNEDYEDKAKDFIREFIDYRSSMNGTGGLDRYLRESTYEAWLQKLRADLDIANLPQDRVPAVIYFYVREEDDRIIGMINIRLACNEFLRTEGGYIGYCVRPSERSRHYATHMLQKALSVCRKMNRTRIVISCDRSNPASAGVIKNCGGILDAEFFSETFREIYCYG